MEREDRREDIRHMTELGEERGAKRPQRISKREKTRGESEERT